MAKLLVTYSTMAGSTAEVGAAVAEELQAQGHSVDLQPVAAKTELADYAGVIVGGPMIVGWHRPALRFLRRHRKALRGMPVAIFVMAMSLTGTAEAMIEGIPLHIDEGLPKPPANPDRLALRERYARLGNYLRPILRALRPVQAASIGVFAGRLEYGRLPAWAVVFAMTILRAPGGDLRNWPAIRAWAAALPGAMGLAANGDPNHVDTPVL